MLVRGRLTTRWKPLGDQGSRPEGLSRLRHPPAAGKCSSGHRYPRRWPTPWPGGSNHSPLPPTSTSIMRRELPSTIMGAKGPVDVAGDRRSVRAASYATNFPFSC